MSFKTWLYFMLFALLILLLLLFFQIILLEPFYKNTLKKDIVNLNKSIEQIHFSDLGQDEKNSQIYSLTANSNACVVIYNEDNNGIAAYDALGENGCAIYSQGNVNEQIITEIIEDPHEEYYFTGRIPEMGNKEIMLYAKEHVTEDYHYYIISNFALQDMGNIMRTTQSQFITLALIIFVLSIAISFIFSRIITRPISDMKNEAGKLSKGNYDLNFSYGEFNELDELSETLEGAAKELSNIDITRKELVANVSHDIRTPLTMIKAYAEMIRDISGSNKKKRNEHLEVIINETDNLNKLVTDMLDLSKFQAGVTEMKIEPFDLSTNLIETAARFNTIAQSEGVVIDIDCDPELMAYGDESKISEVIYNFISNALKHYGNDKLILVSAKLKDKETIRVEVTDHGPGINEEAVPHIWDRYYKNDRHYARAQSGTGLGLAICKAILEQHHADYGVITKLNVGSTFWFELKTVEIE